MDRQACSLSKCFAYPWKHQACIVKKGKKKKKKKKGKFNFKRYQSSQSEFATETRRCSGVLEKSYRDRLHLNAIDLDGPSASLLIFDQSKSRNSSVFWEGQGSDTSCQVVLVDSSHFVDRDRVAKERGAVCDCAKLLYKSLKMKGALLPTIRTTENIRSVQRYSNIRE